VGLTKQNNIPAPRVNPIDPLTGQMSREWYRFFMQFFRDTAASFDQTVDVQDLQLGPQPQPFDEDMLNRLNSQTNTFCAACSASDRVDDVLSSPAHLIYDPYYLEPVWNDVQYQISTAKLPASHYPTWETFTTNTSEYSFAVDDYVDFGVEEYPHWWQEGTDVNIHVHVTTKAANTSGANQYAKIQLFRAYAPMLGSWTETNVSAELTIPNGTAALTSLRLDFPAYSSTGRHIGDHIKTRLKRIAATGGTEYPGNIFINQMGAHVKQNTLGSRLINAK